MTVYDPKFSFLSQVHNAAANEDDVKKIDLQLIAGQDIENLPLQQRQYLYQKAMLERNIEAAKAANPPYEDPKIAARRRAESHLVTVFYGGMRTGDIRILRRDTLEPM